MSIRSTFRQDTTYEDRTKESSRLLEKYPERVPVIVERSENSNHLDIIDNNKFLVPTELKMSQLLWVIRRRMNTTCEQAIFLLSESRKIFPAAEQIGSVYEDNKDPDGFLYLKYSNENTFG
jgi:GABA(A) receptor-associated protein